MWIDIAQKRVALVVAHADDETLAAGAHFKYWPNLTIIHVTDSAPRDEKDARRYRFASWREYAEARRLELDCAMRAGEATHARRIELKMPDQQAIVAVAEVIGQLRDLLRNTDVVITHSYEGGHPDHDACALACRAALPQAAELWEFAGYHIRNGVIESGNFLYFHPDSSEIHVSLTAGDLDRKQRMIACFTSQREVLSQLRPDVESFRPAQKVDFSKPPHEGTLLYETRGFDLNGQRWRELAASTGAVTPCH